MALPEISRRRVLQASCTAGIAALAGCLGGGDGGDDGGDGDGGDDGGDGNGDPGDGIPDVTPYAGYVTTDTDEATAAYADMATLDGVDGFDEGAVEEAGDPLLSLPVSGLRLLSLASLRLDNAGLRPLLFGVDELDSQAGEWVLAGQAFAVVGDVDTAEIDQGLTQGLENAPSGIPYAQTDQFQGYDLYQPAETESELTIAVSTDSVVSGETRDPVERAIGGIRGNRTHATTEFDTFAWVLEAAGDHHVAFAGHGDAPGESEGNQSSAELAGAQSFAAGHSFEGSEVTAEAAAVFDSADALEAASDEIEAAFGTAADDPTFDIGTDRFSVSATYPQDLQAE
jgi:hypothetical protein